MTTRKRLVTAKLTMVMDADPMSALVKPFAILKHAQGVMTKLGVTEWRLDEVRQRPTRRRG